MFSYKINIQSLLFFLSCILIISFLIGNAIKINDNFYLYRIVFLLSFFTIILLIIFRKLVIKKPKISNYLFFLIIFYFYSVFSLNWIANVSESIIYNIYLGIGIFTTIILSLFIKTNYDLKKVFYIWFIIFLFQQVLAFLEIFYGIHISNSRYYEGIINVPTGFFNNENDFATFLIISLSILLFFINTRNIVFISVILLFTVFIIFETKSRTNIITLFLFLILYIKIFNKKMLAFLIVILTLVLIVINNEPFFNLLEIDKIINSADESISVRYNNIVLSISAVLDSYTFGIGAGGMENYISKNSFNNSGITAVHNWYFEILGNFGLIIFLGYLIFKVFIIYSLYFIMKKANDKSIEKKISIHLLFSNVGFLFGCISMSSVIHFLPYWILLGITLAFININRQ